MGDFPSIIVVYKRKTFTELSKNRPDRILSSDNFENVAYVCCDWEEFVFEVAEWGVDHIAQVDFDELSELEAAQKDEFIASFGCSPSEPHPCSKYADPIFA